MLQGLSEPPREELCTAFHDFPHLPIRYQFNDRPLSACMYVCTSPRYLSKCRGSAFMLMEAVVCVVLKCRCVKAGKARIQSFVAYTAEFCLAEIAEEHCCRGVAKLKVFNSEGLNGSANEFHALFRSQDCP